MKKELEKIDIVGQKLRFEMIEKLEHSKKIFEDFGRLEKYKIFEDLITKNIINQNKFELNYFSIEAFSFGELMYDLIREGKDKIVVDIIVNYLGINFKYSSMYKIASEETEEIGKSDILHLACASCNLEMIKLLIDLKANSVPQIAAEMANLKDDYGRGLLFYLTLIPLSRGNILDERNSALIIDYFCELGIDLDSKDRGGKTLLNWMTEVLDIRLEKFPKKDQLKHTIGFIIKHLIKKEVNLKILNSAGISCDYEVKQVLRKLNPKTGLQEYQELLNQKLFEEIKNRNVDFQRIQTVLAKNPLDSEFLDKRGCNMMHYAAWYGHTDVLRLLIAGNNINKRDKYGMTPIMYAAKNRKLDTVLVLAKLGADITIPNMVGETLMHYAAGREWIEVLSLSKRTKNFLPVKTNKGHLPIHRAAFYNSLNSIKYLLNAGQDINAVNNDGDTALHIASIKGHMEIFKYLISKGAARNIVNKAGILAEEIEIFESNKEKTKTIPPFFNSISNEQKYTTKK